MEFCGSCSAHMCGKIDSYKACPFSVIEDFFLSLAVLPDLYSVVKSRILLIRIFTF